MGRVAPLLSWVGITRLADVTDLDWLGKPTVLRDSTPLDWVPATDLWTGSSTWIPRQLCELDFCLEEPLCPPLFRCTEILRKFSGPVQQDDIQRHIRARVGARTELCEDELTRPPFQYPGIPWETALVQEIKISGEFPMSVEATVRILRRNAELSRSVAGLDQALRPERIEVWCAERWNVERTAFDRALQDQGFVCYRAFLELAQLAYIDERLSG